MMTRRASARDMRSHCTNRETRAAQQIGLSGNSFVTIWSVPEIELLEFLDPSGKSPFARWFDNLNAVAAARVTIGLTRLRHGNFSNVESVGTGVSELKLDFGPGYRVYFGKDGERIVILLCGGTKKRQQDDIALASEYWQNYKRLKRSEPWR